MAELDALQQIYPEVLAQGGKMLIISPQLSANSLKMMEEHKLTFPIAFDRDNKLANELRLAHGFPPELSELYLQFGINVPKSNGTDSWELPMPARYLVDKEGLIRDTSINPDYTNRPEPSEMLSLLKALA